MEKPNSKNSSVFVVGLFVFVAMLVGTGFVIFMGGGSFFAKEKTLYAQFDDVGGINKGATVYFGGVKVGRVAEVIFPEWTDTPTNIKVRINLKLSIKERYFSRIKKDSSIKISSMGVLGDKVLVLEPGSLNSELIVEGDTLLAEERKSLGDYLGKGEKLVSGAASFIKELETVVGRLNSGQLIEKNLKNLNKTIGRLDRLLARAEKPNTPIGELFDDSQKGSLSRALGNMESILAKIDSGKGSLGALVNDVALHEDLKILMGGAKRSKMIRFLLRQAIAKGEKTPENSQKQ